MNREQYIEMRTSNQLDMILCYEYYMEHVKDPLIRDLTTFIQHFPPFIQMFGPNFDNMIKHYDVKFNVTVLKDSNGKVIKVY